MILIISLDKAKAALDAAQKKAEELKAVVSIAVVDEHGSLVAFSKMDGAINISPMFSQAKAYTSATVGMPSGDMAGYAAEGKPYYGVDSAMGGKLTVIAGGIPVMNGGKIAGAVGVGGSQDVNQDVEIAKAAVEKLS
ncbi:heme-binding protein [Candidatus Curtissbacteria bacterium]|nr:heme-binding protein [Candidatus Curtissbacteria bacterium]